jgi:hypothetical protein
MKSRIMYIEHKTNQNDRGAAHIGRVSFSQTGKTLTYRGKTFQRIKGGGIAGNYFDVVTGDEYWISGCKNNGEDRHWAGSGPVTIDEDVNKEYSKKIRRMPAPKV